MKRYALLLALPVLALLAAYGIGGDAAPTWEITPKNTKIEFVGTKPNGKHDGKFTAFSGSISVAKNGSGGKVQVEIDTRSLEADVGRLTQHLKSPDFFDVRNHPKASFVATKIEPIKAKDATHHITGKLTLLGKSKEITIPARIAVAGGNLTLTSNFTIDRTDYGMTYGQGKVDNPVKIKVSINASSK